MALEDELKTQLASLGSVLAKRQRTERYLDGYYEGNAALPDAIVRARITRAYRSLMGVASAPWASLICDSVQNRLEVTGINSGDKSVDDTLWEIWQQNSMDAESKLAHNAALVSGRSFALVWPDENGVPEICLDNSSQMVVKYRQGSRRKRVAAMRFWTEDDNRPYSCLYRPDGLFKFRGPKNSTGIDGVQWERWDDPEDEEWPVPNPWGFVPVVELAANRRLKPGSFGYARGEFQHCTSLIDRINLLVFLGLVIAFWMGFPLRAIVGEKILRDDDNNVIPPFDIGADEIAQLENPNVRFEQFQAADRSNLSVYAEIDTLSSITQTPRHYFPMASGMANLSADAIRASEGSLISKVPSHKASFGEGWEETMRMSGAMLDTPIELPQTAELSWKDSETRSLAERADAAVKLKDILPQAALIEYVLGATAEEQARWLAQRSGDVLSQLLTEARTPVAVPTVPTTPPAASNGAAG
jgi:SPP1 Gp6-like portal protein